MAENDFNLLPLLDYINPATVDYQTWVNIGMALKHEDTRHLIGIIGRKMIAGTRNSNASRNGIPSTKKQEQS